MKTKFLAMMRLFAMVSVVLLASACGDKDDENPAVPGQEKPGQVETDYDVAVAYDSEVIGLEETDAPGIYAGTINFSADTKFSVVIKGTTYGFISFSGNGGVGEINTVYAVLPFYNAGVYNIDKSRGQLSESGNDLWINTGSGGKVYVEIDLSYADEKPRYFLQLVEEDNDVILKESFDLFVWGGDWVQAKKGTKRDGTSTSPLTNDGTEAGTPNGAAITEIGTAVLNSDDAIVDDRFYKNRGLDGWVYSSIYEMAGYIRLSTTPSGSSIRCGYIKTPPLTKLTEATTITVSFDICRFSSTDAIAFTLEGPGAITAGEFSDTDTPLADFGISSSVSKALITTSHAQSWSGVNGSPKYFTHFKFTITGATSATQIIWSGLPEDTGNPFDGTPATSGTQVRVCLDNILIKK